jgi:MFS family permease
MLGFFHRFELFVFAIFVVTVGEAVMSPPGMTLTSRLAPPGRMGRYMGIRGFAETAGWSLGPLYGGFILDSLGGQPIIAWITISSLALVAAYGYFRFGKWLPLQYNIKE